MRSEGEPAKAARMTRKAVLPLCIAASGVVTFSLTFPGSALRAAELLVLHLFFFVDMVVRPPSEGTDRQSRRQALWGKTLMLLLIYLPLYLTVTGTSPELLWIEALGIGFTTFGAILGLWSRIRLGRMATDILTIVEKHALYKQGVYGLVRHPIYSGFALAFLGHAVTFLSVPGVVVWILFIATFLRSRIRVEEEMLAQEFGAKYRRYQRDTWTMFPYIY